MSRHFRGINANSQHGRLLLALRAGRMTNETIVERFPSLGGSLGRIKELGHIEQCDGYYVLTEAGRAICPSRRAAPLEPMHEGLSTLSRKERAQMQQGGEQ